MFDLTHKNTVTHITEDFDDPLGDDEWEVKRNTEIVIVNQQTPKAGDVSQMFARW